MEMIIMANRVEVIPRTVIIEGISLQKEDNQAYRV